MPIKNLANHYTMRAGIEASKSRQLPYVSQADINSLSAHKHQKAISNKRCNGAENQAVK
jgi:hypothetical protein